MAMTVGGDVIANGLMVGNDMHKGDKWDGGSCLSIVRGAEGDSWEVTTESRTDEAPWLPPRP